MNPGVRMKLVPSALRLGSVLLAGWLREVMPSSTWMELFHRRILYALRPIEGVFLPLDGALHERNAV